jgi:hypothetical protein
MSFAFLVNRRRPHRYHRPRLFVIAGRDFPVILGPDPRMTPRTHGVDVTQRPCIE